MQKKLLTMLLVLFLALTTLTACSGSSDDPDTMKLTFYYPVQVGGSAAKIIDGLVEDYTKENPNVVVEPVYTGNYDDTVTKIQTAVQGGTPPDVFISLATQRFTLASTNIAEPLDRFIDEDPDGKEYIDDFLEGFMEDSYVDGKIYSIPFQRSTMVLYYNKDAFEEVGLDPEKPPTTWEEMVDYSKLLTGGDRKGVGIALNSGSAQWAFTGFALQNSVNGENLMTEDGKKVMFNTPENVEALQLWLDLQNVHESMEKGIVQWTDLPTDFLAGNVAMIYHTTGNMANISQNAEFEFGTAFLPGSKRVAAPTGGGNFYISSGIDEERKQAAWDFIKFATSTENAAKWSLETGYVPTRTSSIESKTMQDYYNEIPQAKIAYEQLPFAKPELTTYDAAEIWRILNDGIQSAVTGEKTAKEALDSAQELAEDVLKEYN